MDKIYVLGAERVIVFQEMPSPSFYYNYKLLLSDLTLKNFLPSYSNGKYKRLLSEEFRSINPKGWTNYETLYSANYLRWVGLNILAYVLIVKHL